MTKEYTREVLKDLPWKLDKKEQDEALDAVGKAIACINALDTIKDYLQEFAKEMGECKAVDMSKEIAVVKLVQSFVGGAEKGVFTE